MEDKDKNASWLELFYDVAFIALVAQLTYLVTEHHSTLQDFLNIFMVGYTIFIAWWATTANRNLQPQETPADKLSLQLQMVVVFLMSIFMSEVFDGNYVGFFLSLAAVRGLQACMMMRMYAVYPQTRPQTYNILQGFFISAGLWALSAIALDPYHFVIAFSALALDILIPLTRGKGNTKRYLNVYHLQERLGLFLMLVIGESMIVVALSNSAESQLFDQSGVVFSGLGLMGALWWLYFEHSDKYEGTRPRDLFTFIHAHGFLFGSIILVSAGYKILLDAESPAVAYVLIMIGMAGIATTLLAIRATLHPLYMKAGAMLGVIGVAGGALAVYGYHTQQYVEFVVVSTLLFIVVAVLDYRSLFRKIIE